QTGIPSWEKAFCLQAGSFTTWENFLKAKKHSEKFPKVLQWDDSGAEEAFHTAKNRYFARINGLPYTTGGRLMDPDIFNDEIEWDDECTEQSPEEIRAKADKEEDEEDYLYYCRLIDEMRLGHANEVWFLN
ncbi:hypothetical protein F511_08357, partial [Dorcoceras hygrometricum]